MRNLFEAFWKICFFKLAPQDLPASSFLMLSSSLAYGIVSVMVGVITISPAAALPSAVLDMALMGAMTMLLLWIRELGARFQQTFTALMGTGAIFGFLAVPLLALQALIGEQIAVIPSILMLVLIFWNLGVVGHILRHAISAPFYVGVLLAILYMYVSISVMRSLFSPAS